MLDFLASIMDAGGNVPMFGDADDGLVARLDAGRRTSAATARCSPPARCSSAAATSSSRRGALDDRTRWLLGAEADARVRRRSTPSRRACRCARRFPRAATSCSAAASTRRARSAWWPTPARSATARSRRTATPTRSRSRFRSAAASSWSTRAPTRITRRSAWRRYFRGTSAHNTVRIDGLDQSVSGGNFMWLRKARAGCSLWLSSPEKDSFEGWHDGYMRLDDPVKHRRLIELDKPARRVLIEDTLEMGEEHDVELFFHCSEHCRVDAMRRAVSWSASDGVSLSCIAARTREARPSRVPGQASRRCSGWGSRAFDVRQPGPDHRLAGAALSARSAHDCGLAITVGSSRRPWGIWLSACAKPRTSSTTAAQPAHRLVGRRCRPRAHPAHPRSAARSTTRST